VALHWYHPLSHWLAARQRLEQELAADDRAAPLAGGRGAYREALASLALAHQPRPALGLAQSLLPPAWTSTLLRRIEMLRTRQDVERRPAPAVLRYAGYAALIGFGALLAGMRGPGGPLAPAALAGESSQAGAARTPAADPRAMSLAHVPDDATVVLALRPGPFLERSDVRGMLDALAMQPEVGRVVGLVDPRSIEQITVVLRGSPVSLWMSLSASNGNPEGLALLDAAMIVRTRTPRDWVGLARALLPVPVVETRRHGRTYYAIAAPEAPVVGVGLYQPDDRTAIVASTSAIASYVAPRRPDNRPAWAASWDELATGEIALAADVAALSGPLQPMLDALAGAEGGGSDQAAALLAALGMVGPLWEDTESLLLAADAADRFALRLAADCPDAEAATRVGRTLDALLALSDNSSRRYFPLVRRAAFREGEVLAFLPVLDLAEELLRTAKVDSTDPRRVRLSMSSRADLAGLVRLFVMMGGL
jgi:hypothetical protein